MMKMYMLPGTVKGQPFTAVVWAPDEGVALTAALHGNGNFVLGPGFAGVEDGLITLFDPSEGDKIPTQPLIVLG